MTNDFTGARFERRNFLVAAGALAAFGVLPRLAAAARRERIEVYKSPTCGCCGEWVAYLRAKGFEVSTHDLNDMTPIRRRYGVPSALASCHTAVVAGYAIEGHVPAEDMRRLLRERPKIVGLSVPGMAIGSPGMEQGPPQPYTTVAFDERRYWAFAQH